MTLNEVRRVSLTDNYTTPGLLASVRQRKWQWTDDFPNTTGHYAVRSALDHSQKAVWFLDFAHPKTPIPHMQAIRAPYEWSDRPLQWPLERGRELDDPEPETVWKRRSTTTEPPVVDVEDDADEFQPSTTAGRFGWRSIFAGLCFGALIGVLIALVFWTLMHH